MKLYQAMFILFAATSCAEQGQTPNSTDTDTDTGTIEPLVATVNVSAQAAAPSDDSLPGVVDLVLSNAGLDSELGSVIPANAFSDGIAPSDFRGVWDITGSWDSVDNDIAYLVIKNNEDNGVSTYLYDYDADEAGSGQDCYKGPFTGNLEFLADKGLTVIDGPFPLNGVLSMNGDDSSMTMHMLDLLDINDNANHEEIIFYSAVRVGQAPDFESNMCQ